ncbi:4-alpha-glucanotransferase [Arboricoccus pini]|uniref:4-alpha-glucanotransferase n=1 Tax=Arboricoccus pini TaxID=1963835 RepID=A0A212QQ21_9PROT|nr:4-alpha-glucanotransferase [Arboricoccus pini]SNB61574.1 4-alpha-glucanotransferase [Arboricoccus pini]
MTDMSTLHRLASRAGVQLTFWDARGQEMHATDETLRALLAAIGLDSPDEAAACRHLEALDERQDAGPMPPVIVARLLGDPLRIGPVALTEGTAWRLELEDGQSLEGELAGGIITLPPDLPPGYHQLLVTDARTMIILAPSRCWLPPTLDKGGKTWGITAQLYLLRSQGNWGIGDFSDLVRLTKIAAVEKADAIGLNPLHALFLDTPESASPYSPASRLWLNPLYIDIEGIPELRADEATQALLAAPAFKANLAEARSTPQVTYARVAALKLAALHSLHRHFAETATEQRKHAFARFKKMHGQDLRLFCVFQALRLRKAGLDPAMPDFSSIDHAAAHWRNWEPELQEARSAAVDDFATAHAELVDFIAWLQWVADGQLAAAAGIAHDLKLEIGLYRDLAVGADAGGAETWIDPSVVVAGAHAGAPPDIFNPNGQDWGLPPFNPRALRLEAYRSFIQLVSANMRHAGGLRIDHVLGLQRLWWVPAGKSARHGAYMTYPFDDLAAILALESHRHRCLVVGEDLGTVPEGFRAKMADYGILSYKLLFFEQDSAGNYLPPAAYASAAMATVSSHDLPTLAGWWAAEDIKIREDRHLYSDPEEGPRQRRQREADKAALLAALSQAGLMTGDRRTRGLSVQGGQDGGSTAGAELQSGQDPATPVDPDDLSLAVHSFLGRSHSAIAMVQVDELMRETAQVNLPATTDQYPNWRRKAAMTLEELEESGWARELMQTLAQARHHQD